MAGWHTESDSAREKDWSGKSRKAVMLAEMRRSPARISSMAGAGRLGLGGMEGALLAHRLVGRVVAPHFSNWPSNYYFPKK